MNPLSLFKSWLLDVPTASDYKLAWGHWSTFEGSIAGRYISYSVVGGGAPRELSTRTPQLMLTIVGAKEEGVSTIQGLAEGILAYAEQIPPQCAIVAVNPLGDIIGPMTTSGGRPLLTLTLQMIL